MLAVVKTKREPGVDLLDLPEPKITREDEVLLEVGACGVCGTDLHTYLWSTEALPASVMNMKMPRVLGHEVAGTIREMGKDVVNFRVGDRVMCETSFGCGVCFHCHLGRPNLCDHRARYTLGIGIDGGYARYMVIRSACLFKVPEGVSLEEAALMEIFALAVHAIDRSHLKAGDHVVVLGPGPIGLLGAMLAKANGAASVLVAGLAIDKDRLAVASQIGADIVDISADSLSKRVLHRTDGRGADVVFDFAGAPPTTAVDVTRKGGEIVYVGLGNPGVVDPKKIVSNELTIVGVKSRLPANWDRAGAILASKAVNLKTVITDVLPLRQAEHAFQLLEKRNALKLVLVP